MEPYTPARPTCGRIYVLHLHPSACLSVHYSLLSVHKPPLWGRIFPFTGLIPAAYWGILNASTKVFSYCLQQRKTQRFSRHRKLTHTGTACGADPHRDPHGETSGRNTWSKEFPTSSFLRQKRPQPLVPQRLEGILSLGKDEVGGSNPPSSSIKSYRYRCVWRKARRINRFQAFLSSDFFF